MSSSHECLLCEKPGVVVLAFCDAHATKVLKEIRSVLSEAGYEDSWGLDPELPRYAIEALDWLDDFRSWLERQSPRGRERCEGCRNGLDQS